MSQTDFTIIQGNNSTEYIKLASDNVSPLSKVHIRPKFIFRDPKIEFWLGGSQIRVTIGKERIMDAERLGANRETIKIFSWQAHKRLLDTVARTRRDNLPLFVLLTYPDKFPLNPLIWKRDLKIFFQRINRAHPKNGSIWKLEPQDRGAPHFHLLIWECELENLIDWVPENWYEIAGQGDPNHLLFHQGKLHDSKPCVQQIHSYTGTISYASKYLGKIIEKMPEQYKSSWSSPGRFWGINQRENIPWASKVDCVISQDKAYEVIRAMKRFARGKIRNRQYPSLKLYCDAEQWFDKLDLQE